MATATANKPRTTKAPKVKDQALLIGGKWQDSVSGKTFPAINPATGELWLGSNESNDLAVVTPTGSLVSLIDVAPMGINFEVSGLAFKNDFDLLVGTTQGDVIQIHDPTVSIPQTLTGTAGTTITVLRWRR